MKYDAYFPMSWIYNTDGVLVGDLFYHCVFDIGQPSTAILSEMLLQQHRCVNGNINVEVEKPFIVSGSALTIPVPWKLLYCGWEHSCSEEDSKYVTGIDAKSMNLNAELLESIKRRRKGAHTYYAPFTCFADGEFIASTTTAPKCTFSILVSPFSANTTGLYFLYDSRTVTTQCPDPIMPDMIALYKKSCNHTSFLATHVLESFASVKTTSYVADIEKQKTSIAEACLTKKAAAENREQLTCAQLMGNAEAPYTVVMKENNIRELWVSKPVQMNAESFDCVRVVEDALKQGTCVKLGKRTNAVHIGGSGIARLLGTHKDAAEKESCVSYVTVTHVAELKHLTMVAAVPNAQYLNTMINNGTAGVTKLEMSIPYISQPTQQLDLRSVGEHCASVHMEFGMQPAETAIFSAPACYRYGMIVTQPKCGVLLHNTMNPTKHEGKFSVSDRHLTFYLPTFSRSSTVYVDTTNITQGRHTISFVDTCYLTKVSRLYATMMTRTTQQNIAICYMNEAKETLRKLGLPAIYASDELKYWADVPRTLTNVFVKIRATTCILLSSALNMTINITKQIKTLVLVELETAVPNATVHIYGDVDTLRIYADKKQQYTYFVHGFVGQIICEEQGYSRDVSVELADAWDKKLTVHVPQGSQIKTGGTQNKETVIYCSADLSRQLAFGCLVPISGNKSAINNRIVLRDRASVPSNPNVNLIADLQA